MNSGRGIANIFLRNTSVTTWLIIINCMLFIIFSVIIGINPDYLNYIAIKPSAIFHGQNLWTVITSMFMHSGFAHLFFNMFTLFFIGSFVEKLIGRKRFIWFYLISGIIAGIFFSLLAYYFGNLLPGIFSSPDTIAVGASGAIFGLIGILAVLVPRAKVYLIAGPLIAIIIEAIAGQFLNNSVMSILSVLVSIYFFVSIFAIFSFNPKFRKLAIPIELAFWLVPIVAIIPLIIIGFYVALPIGNTAHFGGLIIGLIYGWYLRNKYKKRVKMLNKYIAR